MQILLAYHIECRERVITFLKLKSMFVALCTCGYAAGVQEHSQTQSLKPTVGLGTCMHDPITDGIVYGAVRVSSCSRQELYHRNNVTSTVSPRLASCYDSLASALLVANRIEASVLIRCKNLTASNLPESAGYLTRGDHVPVLAARRPQLWQPLS